MKRSRRRTLSLARRTSLSGASVRADEGYFTVELSNNLKTSGGDALRGHTRSHPEHDG